MFPPVYSKTLRMSREDVTRLEISGHIVVSNVPAMLLLKDTISDSIAEAFDECIQARFGRCRMITVKDLQEVITNHSNFVAMETHNRLTIFLTVVNIVLPDCQSLLLAIASFICCSILRMRDDLRGFVVGRVCSLPCI